MIDFVLPLIGITISIAVGVIFAVAALSYVVYVNRSKRAAEPKAPPHSLPPDGDPGVVPNMPSMVSVLTSPAAASAAIGMAVGGSGSSAANGSPAVGAPRNQSGPEPQEL